jgi:hypothetical protein
LIHTNLRSCFTGAMVLGDEVLLGAIPHERHRPRAATTAAATQRESRKPEPAPKSLRKNRLAGRSFPLSELIALRSVLFSVIQRVGTPDFRRFHPLGLPDRGHLATPLGNLPFMRPPLQG